jgi:biopolymer transport protein TolR
MAGKVQGSDGSPAGRRGRRTTTSLAEINVVPLVDVMLVLLIIFMVTAPMIQRGIEVNLPEARRADRIEGDRIFVTIPQAYRTNRRLMLGDETLGVDVLQERIRQRMETAATKEVYLQSDGAVQMQDFVEVTDRLRAAGVARVGIVTRLPGER